MENKRKQIYAKTLRFLGLTKPIELDKYEKKWIKLIKGHYRKDPAYAYKGNEWTDILKPMFDEMYGWSSEEHYGDFLGCIFRKLLSIYLKIADDNRPIDSQLSDIFCSSFSKGLIRNQDLPIERAISELCGQIQCNTVIENGVDRYII